MRHKVSFSRTLSSSNKAFLLVLGCLAALIAYRAISYWVTGFFVSDEYGYYYDALHGTVYGGRWFFGGLNIALFQVLGINSVDRFAYLLPFYLFSWAALTISALYMTLRTLGFDDATTGLTLVASLFAVSFDLLSLGFLTEPVGLSLSMFGIYFLVKFAKANPHQRLRWISYAVASSLFFVAATYSREPYVAFLVGSIPLVAIIAFRRTKAEGFTRAEKYVARLGPPIVASAAAIAFLVYPDDSILITIQSQAWLIGAGLVGMGVLAGVIKLLWSRSNRTLYRIIALVILFGALSFLVLPFLAGTVHLPSPPTNENGALPHIQSTALIFVGGLALGWGPVAFVIGIVGFASLAYRFLRERNPLNGLVLGIILLALVSYLGVSYIFSPDPNYFSFSNYSTVIRFSDTAIPALFLLTPFAVAMFARNRRQATAFLALSASVLLLLVPIYEVYAASNLPSAQSANPFAYGYRSPAVQIRNYFESSGANGSTYVAGLPYGWVFTPGVQDLKSVHVFTLRNNGRAPYLNYTYFLSLHWSSFYIYSSTPSSPAQDLPPFLAALFASPSDHRYPYSSAGINVSIQGADFVLLKVDLLWR